MSVGGGLIQVKSTVKMNFPRITQLTQAAVTALEMTAEALHTEVVQAQVMPFETGNLQNESTFVDYSESKSRQSIAGFQYALCAPSVLSSGVQLPDGRKLHLQVELVRTLGCQGGVSQDFATERL